MQLLLLSLLFDLLVLSQQFFAIVLVIVIRRIWVYTLFDFIFFTIIFDKLFRVSIFWKWIVSQINCTIFFIWFDFFGNIRLVVSNKIYIVIVNIFIFSVSYLLLLDNLYLSIFLSSSLCFSLQQLGFKVFLFQLIKRSLTNFSFFQFQITWQILNLLNCTLAE